MNSAQIIVKMHKLHEVRMTMSYASIYHSVYENECIKLNSLLVKLCNKNYFELNEQDIRDAYAESELISFDEEAL